MIYRQVTHKVTGGHRADLSDMMQLKDAACGCVVCALLAQGVVGDISYYYYCDHGGTSRVGPPADPPHYHLADPVYANPTMALDQPTGAISAGIVPPSPLRLR